MSKKYFILCISLPLQLTFSDCALCGCSKSSLSLVFTNGSCSYLPCIRYNREWRYHKEERIWLTRAPGLKLSKAEATFEEGTYFYFDVNSWRKAHKELRVEYEKLEDRPQIPPALSAQMVSSLSVNSWCVFTVICVWKCINSVHDLYTHLLSWDDFPMKDFHCFLRARTSIHSQRKAFS